LIENARAANNHTPTTPRTRLFGGGGWRGWTASAFRGSVRARRRAEALGVMPLQSIVAG